MAMIVLDPCTIGFTPNDEGATLKIHQVEGFPEGLSFILPLGDTTCEQLHDSLGEKLGKSGGPSIVTATPDQVHQEAKRHGLD